MIEALIVLTIIAAVALLTRPSDAELHHAAQQEARRRRLDRLVAAQRHREAHR